MPPQKVSTVFTAVLIAFIASLIGQELFYLKILNFINASSFGSVDPVFSKDIGYYLFTRPFFISVYGFASAIWGMLTVYALLFYLFKMSSVETGFTPKSIKDKSIITHNIINVAVFFLIKAASYPIAKQDILYNNVVNYKGAGYVDVNIWLKYYTVVPFLIVIAVAVALLSLKKNKLKLAAAAIAVYPAAWLLTVAISAFTQHFIVSPNEFNYEKKYISYNIEKTREAYNLDRIKTHDFPAMQELTPEIVERNRETINNVRVIDIPSTLISNIQLQSNTAFYTFNNGDIINYTVNGKNIPVFITAREIDKNRLPDKTYLKPHTGTPMAMVW
jgi:uncharacterized membrane protein (UPF0182 family)